MRSCLSVMAVLFAWAGAAQAQGLLLPADQSLPPLALVKHQADVTIEDQVATTQVEQTFHNPTGRQLEATYLFPVPKGASVNKFAMWVDGKKVAAEMVQADQARQTYTEIVRRTQDPGLLEYVGNNLVRLRVFPVPANGDQKVALSFTSVAAQDAGAIEYIYPLKGESKSASTIENFSLKARIKSQHGVQNVYSPTHSIDIQRLNDHEVQLTCKRNQAPLDKDFQLFYSLGDKDVGLTALTYRPLAGEDGHFLMLLSPRVELAKQQAIPRDLVLVLDTSGSMQGDKIEQARKALKFCLGQLHGNDRFGLINFASSVNKYREHLVDSNREQIENARKWVDRLEANGGTDINDALLAALAMRSSDAGRTFTIVFFTDGQPTAGECDPQKIVKNVLAQNSANTRIFTFGVGHDDGINATLLDQLAEQTRAVSTFVQPGEDIEAKVSGLYAKISHPVLANLKLTVGDKIQLQEVYPPQLPDLFHGGQLVVLGRYSGQGPATVKLTGTVGKQTREFVYETTFARKTGDDKVFVEQLWARRKVGFLLDQIRANGEKKELVEEVVKLAKKHGIATPYTSYLIAPDSATPVANGATGTGNLTFGVGVRGFADTDGSVQNAVDHLAAANGQNSISPTQSGSRINYAPVFVAPQVNPVDYYKSHGYQFGTTPATAVTTAVPAPVARPVSGAGTSGEEEEEEAPPTGPVSPCVSGQAPQGGMGGGSLAPSKEALQKKQLYEAALLALKNGNQAGYQAGRVGVELSVELNNLRNQSQLDAALSRTVKDSRFLQVGGAWIDEGFKAEMKTITVKAMSPAYFRILEKHPEAKEVFQMGNQLLWVTPSGTALVISAAQGQESLTDKAIERLFSARK